MAKKKSQSNIPDADLSGAGGDAPPAAEGGESRRRSCGTMQVHYRMLAESPAYAQALSRIENLAFEFEQGHRTAARGVTRIPVVVHVVWRTNAENISDQQIQSQIDVLNRDFRATNTDVGSTPQVWQGIVGDSRLEFFLATQDPNGNPTNGVIRRQTTVAGFSSDDAVKSAASGGTDPWPSDRYLNIWVCELGGGLLGYAQFPGGLAATDGVVITHSAFGTVGTAAAPFNLGRTATHEIGHWLNLRHIWGDDGNGCGGDDLVADTPNQGDANVGCPTFPHVSCNNDPNGDMFMNYMDYVDDGCMVMFTQGQVARMEAALVGPRASFLNQSLRLAHAMWTHGHSMDIEFPDRLLSTWPAGFYMRVEGKQNTDNWFHFAIPTPVIVNDQRLCVGSVMLRFRTRTSRAYVHAVHIYDGDNLIQAYDNLRLSPNQWSFERFNVPAHPEVVWGLGISIGVRFRGSRSLDNRMEFSSAGCDFLL